MTLTSDRMVAAGIATCSSLAIFAGASTAQAEMLIEYRIDEPTSTPYLANTGTAPGLGTMRAYNGSGDIGVSEADDTDLHSAPGTGVSGAPTDRAFVATAPTISTTAGDQNMGDTIVHSFTNSDFSDFTISGWFKVESGDWGASGSNNGITLMSYRRGDNWNFNLSTFGGEGDANPGLALKTDGNMQVGLAGTSLWDQPGEWNFFAVSYNGSAVSDADRLKFFAGDTADSVALVATADMTAVTFNADYDRVAWGADYLLTKGFSGLMDNLRFHNEALGQSQLETLRVSDVPEPSSLALLAVGAVAMLRRRH